MKQQNLSGLIAAPFTPMNEDGTIQLSRIKPYADYLINKKCIKGVFICGTSGESVSLTTKERKNIAEQWVNVAKGKLKVIVHVGGMSQMQCIDLASHAQSIGADMIAAMAPCFFKPTSIKELIDFFSPVAAAANRLPFYYYNMPSITGVSLPVHTFLTEGKKLIPNLAGVKFTHNNLMEMQQCIHADNGSFEVLHGFDEILITGLSVGAKAAVGSTYNYIPALYNIVMNAMEKGDLRTAQEAQWKAVEIVDILIKHGGGVRGGKLFMKLAGFDCGPCRLPIAPFSQKELDETKKELMQTDFYKYI
ncbi:MAG: dihydrodipicolinate synthase family protein [Mediterranea sp.]|nr:dihydrodipicolinate synthase family protein [Mediterranea sp.]